MQPLPMWIWILGIPLFVLLFILEDRSLRQRAEEEEKSRTRE